VSRLQAGDDGADAELGLHFDLTVPLARYVLENAGRLVFPFKRYQIQPVWRGERPQDGRFREFVQADIDVIGNTTLPFHYEVEIPLVMADAFAALAAFGVPPIRIGVNNRKLAEGFYRGVGLTDVPATLNAIDKLAKIGPDAVSEILVAGGATPAQAAAALELATLDTSDDVAEPVNDLAERHGATSDLLTEGLSELAELLAAAHAANPGVVVADLSIARGLDYYTGSVYETILIGHEGLGSVCSGGRYDNLVSDGSVTYPGVGLSVGVTRLLSRLLNADLVSVSRPVPTAVLVAVTSEDTRDASNLVAQTLRRRGIAADTAPTADKFGKQIRYADRNGIPFVWFPDAGQVKDIRSGDQVDADPATWSPPEADVWPRVQPR